MADQIYLTALQPFLALAKNAGPAQAADTIRRATEAPDCYVFAELLEQPSIRQLAEHEEYGKWYHLLRIFAYGSYSDYLSELSSRNLPPLSEPQLLKLKQLTLVTLSSQGGCNLTYASLLRTLDLPTVRSLEDLIISAIYASLLEAKLDTANQRIEVSSTAGRDVGPGEVQNIIGTLENWCKQCEGVLRDIDEQIAQVRRLAVQKRNDQEEYEAAVRSKKMEHLGSGGGNKGSISSIINEITTASGSGGGSLGKGKRVISEGDEQMQGVYNDAEMDIDDGPAEGGGWGGAQSGTAVGRRRKAARFTSNRT